MTAKHVLGCEIAYRNNNKIGLIVTEGEQTAIADCINPKVAQTRKTRDYLRDRLRKTI